MDHYRYMQKKTERRTASFDLTCPNCGSNDSYSVNNYIGATRFCKCRQIFTPRVTRYEDAVVTPTYYHPTTLQFGEILATMYPLEDTTQYGELLVKEE